MKKKIIILFVIATAFFCVQLYKMLFLIDQEFKGPLVFLLATSILLNCVVLVLLFNAYIRLTSQKK